MPTENPKISLYVPQHIYDRFIEYKDQSGLSMSQAGTVLLAEYFGLEETVKDIREGVTIGGVTLDRVEKIENDIKQLKEQINNLVNQDKINSKLPNEIKELSSSLQGELPFTLGEAIVKEISLTSSNLAKRLNQKSYRSINNHLRKPEAEFYDWSQSQDPDNIAWKKRKVDKKSYYYPDGTISSELLSKLQEWMKSNGVKSEGKVP